jgi:hypothetical protein
MRNIIKQVLKEEFDLKSERIKSIVNKYGFEQASEMVVGGIDTIRQLYENNPESFLNQFNDLSPVETVDKIYYVDKNRLPLFMYYPNRKNGEVYINYYRIWLFFSDVINLNYKEIKGIMEQWLEETYNLRGLTPVGSVDL